MTTSASFRKPPREDRATRVDLVAVDGMRQTGVAAKVSFRAHAREGLAGLDHALEGDVGVGIAAAEEDVDARERAWVIARRAGRADQSAGEGEHGGVVTRVPRGEFGGEARAL